LGGNNLADVQRLSIVADPANANGSTFGGIRMGNAVFGGESGVVGIAATNVAVQDVVVIGDINATGSATPTLNFGANSQFGVVRVAGGDLVNSKTIGNSGYKYDVSLNAGTTSGGTTLAASTNYAGLSFTQAPASVAASSPVSGKGFNLTAGVDEGAAFAGTSANDTYLANPVSTFSSLDSLNGGGGTDTLAITEQTSTPVTLNTAGRLSSIEVISIRVGDDVTADVSGTNITGLETIQVIGAVDATITAGRTTSVSINDATGAIVVNGGSSSSINAATAGQTVTVGATTVGTGAVSIVHTNQVNGAIAIDGGTSIGVTASKATTGTISVGSGGAPTDPATGAVTIATSGAAYTTADANVTRGTITVVGGTTVAVNQTATSDRSAQTADTANTTITQGAITVTGTSLTTAVEVNQSAAVTKVDAIAAVAGSRETAVVTFPAMTAGESVTVNGLTFTASKTLTSLEVASAFANLASGTTIGSAPASSGIYSNAFSGVAGATGAASAVSDIGRVTYTASSAGNPNDIQVSDTAAAGNVAATVTNGSGSTPATAGLLGVVGGAVTVNGQITGTDVLSSVTLSGWGAASTIASDALATLNVSNSGLDLTVNNTVAKSLSLGLNGGLTPVSVTSDIDLGGTYETLNLTAATANSTVFITAGGVKTLTLAGDGSVTLNGAVSGANWTSSLPALEAVTVTGAAGLSWTAANGATVKSINTTGTSGNVTLTIDANNATYTGGAGVDSVTLSSTTVSKSINLGGGDDSLTLAAGTTSLASSIAGGMGTDSLVMRATDAATASGNQAFQALVDGFEKLTISAVTAGSGSPSIDLSNLDGISYVTSNGIAAANLGTNETSTVTFSALKSGQLVTVAGRTVTATNGDLTAAEVENAMLAGISAGSAVVSGTLTGFTNADNGTVGDGILTYTASTAGNVTDIAVTNLNAPIGNVLATTTQGVVAVTETSTISFGGLIDGESVTFGGRIVTAVGGNASSIDVAAAAATGIDVNSAKVTGNLTGFSAGTAANNKVTFTAPGGSGDVSDIVVSSTTTMPAVATTQGVNGVTESSLVTLPALRSGQSITIDTLTVQAFGDLTAAQLEAAILGTGATVNFTVSDPTAGDGVLLFTAKNAGNVADITLSTTLALAPNASAITTQGGVGAAAQASLTVTKMANGGTFESVGNATGATTTVTLGDATGAADSLNVVMTTASSNLNHGTLVAPGVEIININAADTVTTAINTHTLALNAASATTLNVSGAGALVLSGVLPNVATLNAASLSGGLTASTNGTTAQTITGGAGGDNLTARGDGDVLNGLDGNDRLNTIAGADLVRLSGGGGTDTFNVGFAPSNVSSFATITDLTAGESIVMSAGSASFAAAKITLAPTAVFQDYANAAINNSATGAVTWFQFGGDTYIVEKVSGGSVFVNGQDIIVKISGLVDLSASSFSSTVDTLIYRPTP
jgi:S-layer protein